MVTQTLRTDYAKITQTLRTDYADITQLLDRHYAELRNSITHDYAIHYAIKFISKSGGNYLTIICNYLTYLKKALLFEII